MCADNGANAVVLVKATLGNKSPLVVDCSSRIALASTVVHVPPIRTCAEAIIPSAKASVKKIFFMVFVFKWIIIVFICLLIFVKRFLRF